MRSATFLLLLVLPILNCAPISLQEASEYLQKYGYVQSSSARSMSMDGGQPVNAFGDSIKKFQELVGLPQTGLLDERTLNEMDAPRCGMADFASLTATGQLVDKKWKKTDLTFSIDGFWNRSSSVMPESNIRSAIRAAFDAYSEVTPLTFKEVLAGEGDIKLKFGEKQHKCYKRFDGRGGEYAHAFYPDDAANPGSVHFDADENWTIMSKNNMLIDHTDFLTTAIHEIGHALGYQDHSKDASSIMASRYRPPKNSATGQFDAPKLDQETIGIMQRKYGTRTPTFPPVKNSHCTSHVYAAASVPGHQIMLFPEKGTKLALFDAPSRKATKLVPVSSIFSSGPSQVCAAYYSWQNSMFMLFHGNQVWGYEFDRSEGEVTLAEGYPKRLPVDADWKTEGAWYSHPTGIIVNSAKTVVSYNERANTVEISGHISQVFKNMPQGVAGSGVMLSHGEFISFTESTVFKYDSGTGIKQDLGSIADFFEC